MSVYKCARVFWFCFTFILDTYIYMCITMTAICIRLLLAQMHSN